MHQSSWWQSFISCILQVFQLILSFTTASTLSKLFYLQFDIVLYGAYFLDNDILANQNTIPSAPQEVLPSLLWFPWDIRESSLLLLRGARTPPQINRLQLGGDETRSHVCLIWKRFHGHEHPLSINISVNNFQSLQKHSITGINLEMTDRLESRPHRHIHNSLLVLCAKEIHEACKASLAYTMADQPGTSTWHTFWTMMEISQRVSLESRTGCGAVCRYVYSRIMWLRLLIGYLVGCLQDTCREGNPWLHV